MAQNRQQEQPSTKEIILDKAQELILERGYENVSIDDIVSACGLTKGAFYYNFKSKKDLLKYPVTRYQFDAVASRLDTSDEYTAYGRIFAYVMEWIKFHEDNGANMARAWMIEHTDPSYHANSTVSNDAFPEDVAHFSHFIDEAVEAGYLDENTPVDTLAQGVCLTLYGRVYSELLTNTKEKPTDWARDWFVPYMKEILFAPYLVECKHAS